MVAVKSEKTKSYMKTIFKTVACLSFLISFAACQELKIDTQMTPEKEAASIRMESDVLEAYTISATNPQPVSFKVASNTPWTITRSDNAEWLAVTPASSSISGLNVDVTITAVENTTYEDRSVTLTLVGEKTEKTYSVTITQNKLGKLYVQPVSENFASTGGSLPFTIETNVAWEARSSEQWLTLSENSGVGDGSVITLEATATENVSIVRKAIVTVVAGEDTETFEVTQKGISLDILPVDNPEVARDGNGELILDVDASIDWKVESSEEWLTAVKTDDGKVKVTATFNNKFAPRKATVTLLPVSSAYGDIKSELEITQAVNFNFSGNYEILEDGSVKLMCGAKSKVTTKDKFRYVTLNLTMGDVSFGSKGELWCAVSAGECNIYSQISLGGSIRLRQDGNLPVTKKPNEDPISTYKNVNLSGIDQAALNAMTEYRFEVLPEITPDGDYDGVFWHVVNFWYNGTKNTTLNFRSVFVDDPTASGNYWFGFNNTTSDDTWYIIKSCDITVHSEE